MIERAGFEAAEKIQFTIASREFPYDGSKILRIFLAPVDGNGQYCYGQRMAGNNPSPIDEI